MAEGLGRPEKEQASRKLVEEYYYLQDKCSAHFSGLRELPAFGKTYAGYFQRTFESYTRCEYRTLSDELTDTCAER